MLDFLTPSVQGDVVGLADTHLSAGLGTVLVVPTDTLVTYGLGNSTLSTNGDRNTDIVHPGVVLLANADLLTSSSGAINLSDLGDSASLDKLAHVIDHCVARLAHALLFAILQAEAGGTVAVLTLCLGGLVHRAGHNTFAYAIDERVSGLADTLLVALSRTIEVARSIAVLADHLGHRVLSAFGDRFAAPIDSR